MTSSRALIAAAALSLATAAPAAGAWDAPQRASTGPGDASAPEVAANGRGDAAMAWLGERAGRPRVVASVRRAGGAWTPPASISPPGRAAADPRVAVSLSGRVVVAWRQVLRTRTLRQGGRRTTQALYVARARERAVGGGGWGPVATLSSPRQKVGPPELAVDRRGVAIATWHWGTGTRPGGPGYVGEIQTAESRPGAGWSAPRRASGSADCPGGSRLPDVAVGPGGHAAVWWTCRRTPAQGRVAAVGRGPRTGAWSRRRTLPVGGDAGQVLRVAVGPGGRLLAASTHAAGAGPGGTIRWWRGATGRAGVRLTRIGAPSGATAARAAGDAVAPALDSAGAGLAAWTRAGGALATADVPPAGGVEAPRDLAPASLRPVSPAAGVGAGGRAVVVAVAGAGRPVARIVASTRGGDGVWSGPVTISAPGAIAPAGSPRLAVDASGDAVAVWTRRAGGRSVVERAEYGAGS